MTKPQFSCGPWRAKRQIPQTGNVPIVSRDGFEVAFATNRAWGYESTKPLSNAETMANARLMAAAPQLLAALLALKTANGGNNFTGWHPAFDGAIKLANEAIELATAA